MKLIISSYQAIKDDDSMSSDWYTQIVKYILENEQRSRNIISIDFGNMTTVACSINVSAAKDMNRLETSVVPYSDKSSTLSNFFYAKKSKRKGDVEVVEISVGEKAMTERKSASTRSNASVVAGDSVKQVLFRDDTLDINTEYDTQLCDGKVMIVNGNFKVDPEDILRKVINEFVKDGGLYNNVQSLGETEIVITHPSGYKGDRIQSYKRCVKGMGFKDVSTCPESTAACYKVIVDEHSSGETHEKNRLFLIVDVGHGTTDVTVCQVNKDGTICEICSEGLTDVGGRDYTRAIAEDIFHTHVMATNEWKSYKASESDYQTKVDVIKWNGWSTIQSLCKNKIPGVFDESTIIKELICDKYADGDSRGEEDFGLDQSEKEGHSFAAYAHRILLEKESKFNADDNTYTSQIVSPQREEFTYILSYKRFEDMTKHLSKKIEDLLQGVISKCRSILGDNMIIDKVVNVGGGTKVPIIGEIEKRLFDTSKTVITKSRSTTCVASGALFKIINDHIEDEKLEIGSNLPKLCVRKVFHEYETTGCSMSEIDKFGADIDIRATQEYKNIQTKFKRRNKELWAALYNTKQGIDAKPFALPGILLPTVVSSSFSITYSHSELEDMKKRGKIDYFLIASKMVDGDDGQSMTHRFRQAISKSEIGLPMSFEIDTEKGDYRLTGTFNYTLDPGTSGDVYSLASNEKGEKAMERFFGVMDGYKVRSMVALQMPFDKLPPLDDCASITASVHLHMLDNDKFTYYYTYAVTGYSRHSYTIRNVGDMSTRNVLYGVNTIMNANEGYYPNSEEGDITLEDGTKATKENLGNSRAALTQSNGSVTLLAHPIKREHTEKLIREGEELISVSRSGFHETIYYGLDCSYETDDIQAQKLPIFKAIDPQGFTFDELVQQITSNCSDQHSQQQGPTEKECEQQEYEKPAKKKK